MRGKMNCFFAEHLILEPPFNIFSLWLLSIQYKNIHRSFKTHESCQRISTVNWDDWKNMENFYDVFIASWTQVSKIMQYFIHSCSINKQAREQFTFVLLQSFSELFTFIPVNTSIVMISKHWKIEDGAWNSIKYSLNKLTYQFPLPIKC